MKILCLVLFTFVGIQAASACDGGRMTADLEFCIRETGRNAPNDYADIVIGACKKDAVKLRNGFRGCQGDGGIRDNYDSCSAGQQIDTARALVRKWAGLNDAECGAN